MSFATTVNLALTKITLRVGSSGFSFKQWWQQGTTKQRKARNKSGAKGEVFIVGAGPGDAELLTMKAHRLLQNADVVLFDWLVSEDLLKLIPASAMRQFVGKRCGQHSFEQKTICNLMVEHARLGRKVVRLKGGDPSVFGRVSEECQALQAASIPFAIVPGITAASGMAAYTGMPLTDRRYAQSVRFITATLKRPEDEPDWAAMVAQKSRAKAQDTLVFYMGLKRIGLIVQRLMSHGMASDMPCAIVDQATLSTQKVIAGNLANIEQMLARQPLEGPALLVVGNVTQAPWPVNTSLLEKEVSIL